jgi:hypothetical protein
MLNYTRYWFSSYTPYRHLHIKHLLLCHYDMTHQFSLFFSLMLAGLKKTCSTFQGNDTVWKHCNEPLLQSLLVQSCMMFLELNFLYLLGYYTLEYLNIFGSVSCLT